MAREITCIPAQFYPPTMVEYEWQTFVRHVPIAELDAVHLDDLEVETSRFERFVAEQIAADRAKIRARRDALDGRVIPLALGDVA